MERTYEAGFIDGLEFTADVDLEKLLRSFLNVVDEYRERKNLLDKIEWMLQKVLDMIAAIREKVSWSRNGKAELE